MKITVTPELLAPKKLALTYELRKADGTLAGTGRSFHIWTGPDNRSYDLEAGLPEVYAALKAWFSRRASPRHRRKRGHQGYRALAG